MGHQFSVFVIYGPSDFENNLLFLIKLMKFFLFLFNIFIFLSDQTIDKIMSGSPM